MKKQEVLKRIRAKKLGLLMYDARIVCRKTVEECAAVMDSTPQEYQAFEAGLSSPSLPALETLAYFLDIPLEHFWGRQARSDKPLPLADEHGKRLRTLRNRYIGAYLRQRRNDRSLSIEELAEQSGLTEEQITLFETGQNAIPLPQLEILADLLVFRVEDLFDQHGPIGQWRAEQEAARELAEMPPHLKAFVLKPVNRPYIELAMRLNDLSVEKLRSIAEGLLEITY